MAKVRAGNSCVWVRRHKSRLTRDGWKAAQNTQAAFHKAGRNDRWPPDAEPLQVARKNLAVADLAIIRRDNAVE